MYFEVYTGHGQEVMVTASSV